MNVKQTVVGAYLRDAPFVTRINKPPTLATLLGGRVSAIRAYYDLPFANGKASNSVAYYPLP